MRVKSFFILCLTAATAYGQPGDRQRLEVLAPATESCFEANAADAPGPARYVYLQGEKKGPATTYPALAYLQFDLQYLPEGAMVDTIQLCLYLDNLSNATYEQRVNISFIAPDGASAANYNAISALAAKSRIDAVSAPFTEAIAGRDDGRITINFKVAPQKGANQFLEKAMKEKSGLGMIVFSGSPIRGRYFSSRSDDPSKGPRLRIVYRLADSSLGLPGWRQPNGDAQHSAMNLVQSNTTADGYKVSTIYKKSSVNGGADFYGSSIPVVCDRVLVFPAQKESGDLRHSIVGMDEFGGIRGRMQFDREARYPLVAANNDSVFAIVAASPSATNLKDTTQAIVCFGAGKISDNATSSRRAIKGHVTATPALGHDGSIYLSTDSGIFAYSAFPEFRLKWRRRPDNAVSLYGIAALSEDERRLYVCGEQGRSLTVYAIDNLDGRLLWKKEGLDYDPEFRDSKRLPMPVAKGGRIFFAAGRCAGADFVKNGSRFYEIADSGSKGVVVRALGASETRVYSNPVAGKNYIDFIDDKGLERIGAASDELSLALADHQLNSGSALLTDGNDDVYVLRTKAGDAAFKVVSGEGRLVVNQPLQTGNIENSFFLPLSSGKFIFGSRSELYSLSPVSYAEKNPVPAPGAGRHYRTNYMYRSAGTVTLSSAITKGKDVVVSSGSGIRLAKGFSIQKGSRLTCAIAK